MEDPAKNICKGVITKSPEGYRFLDNNHFTIYNKAGNYMAPNKANLLKVKRHPELYNARQSSGYDNALGNIVFRFKNSFDIYLHDTPEKQLFQKEERAFSHSCIRVENAQHLAELLLKYGEPQ